MNRPTGRPLPQVEEPFPMTLPMWLRLTEIALDGVRCSALDGADNE
jgi:hypothetical protein